ncbi:cation diffusion facilitator family transporter [Bdellovibrionota bacterium FG-2]
MSDKHDHHGYGPGHTHGHDHAHKHRHLHAHSAQAPKALIRAMIVTIIFMVVELVGGYFSNSLALISDGAHMLTDVGAILLSLFALWMARRPANWVMSFGYHRAEILGALASGLAIWLISGLLVYEAVQRMRAPPEVNGPIVFVVAVVGLIANLVSMRMLNGAQHDSLNVRGAYLHLLSDALGSVGAVLAGGVLWWTGWRPIDPIITVLFAALMLLSSWSLVKESLSVLMESTPSSIDPQDVKHHLLEIAGVQEVHDLHIWSVGSGKLALSVHMVTEVEEALEAANELMEKEFGIAHTTIQIEHPKTFRSERCYDCTPLELKRMK